MQNGNAIGAPLCPAGMSAHTGRRPQRGERGARAARARRRRVRACLWREHFECRRQQVANGNSKAPTRIVSHARARARIAKLATRAQMRDRQQMRQHSPASALLIIMQPPTVWHGPERPKSMTRGWGVLDGWVVVWSASMPRTHVLVVWRPVVVAGIKKPFYTPQKKNFAAHASTHVISCHLASWLKG